MRYRDIMEGVIPETPYGYWITQNGEFIVVSRDGDHEVVANQHFGETDDFYETAGRAGWIRVAYSKDGSHVDLCVDTFGSSTSKRAISALFRLVKNAEVNRFFHCDDAVGVEKFYATSVQLMRSVSETCSSTPLSEARTPTYYIRFGDIPEGERSIIGGIPNHLSRRATPGDAEKGVSVFNTRWDAERQRWSIEDVGNYASLDAVLGQRRPAYLVTGKRVGFGIDQETLLRNVKIVKTLPYDAMWILAYGNDGGCEEYLVDYDD